MAERRKRTRLRSADFMMITLTLILVIFGITLLAVTVALTIGCPVLGFLFNADIMEYKTDLAILMVGGGMLALVNFFTVVVTVVRGQNHLMVGYVAVAIAAKLMSHTYVARYGIMGATVLYTVLMTLLAFAFAAVLIICVKKKK